jgi:hypothetical protein
VRVDAAMSTDMSTVPSTAPTLSPIAYQWHCAVAAQNARTVLGLPVMPPVQIAETRIGRSGAVLRP